MNASYQRYILSVLLFGSNGIIASFIALNSYEIVFLRTLIGCTLLIILFFATKNTLTAHHYKKDLIFIALSGASMGASWMFLYEAYVQIGVSISTLIYYCAPVIMMALSPILFKERLTWVKVVGFLVVLSGVILVNGRIVSEGSNSFGILCVAMATLTFAALVMFNKQSHHVFGMENAMIQMVFCLLTVGIFVFFKQGLAIDIARSDILPILVLGLLNTGIGCYFYFSSIGHLPVQTVAICGYLEPLSAVLFSVIFLHETLIPIQIVGAVLIIGGALFGELMSRRLELQQEEAE